MSSVEEADCIARAAQEADRAGRVASAIRDRLPKPLLGHLLSTQPARKLVQVQEGTLGEDDLRNNAEVLAPILEANGNTVDSVFFFADVLSGP